MGPLLVQQGGLLLLPLPPAPPLHTLVEAGEPTPILSGAWQASGACERGPLLARAGGAERRVGCRVQLPTGVLLPVLPHQQRGGLAHSRPGQLHGN